MQVLCSLILERTMSDATCLANADNQQCKHGAGPGATGIEAPDLLKGPIPVLGVTQGAQD